MGYSYTSAGSTHAFLYSNGQMRDLNDLIDPAFRVLLSAVDINDNGQILAMDNRGPVVLTPIPEPSTLALFGVALLGLGVWARRHPILSRGTAKRPTT